MDTAQKPVLHATRAAPKCVNCYHRAGNDTCAHPTAAVDPVYGMPQVKCQDMRQTGAACSPDAQLFEPRPAHGGWPNGPVIPPREHVAFESTGSSTGPRLHWLAYWFGGAVALRLAVHLLAGGAA